MSIVSRLINDPNAYSVEMLQRGVQAGTIPPYIGIPLIQEKIQQKREMQGAQGAGPMPTVAEQVMAQAQQAEAPPQQMARPMGLGALRSNLPEQFAHGGIVALASGGDTSDLVKMLMEGDEEDDDEYNDAIRGAMKYIDAMRESAMHMPEGAGLAPQMAAREAREGVTVKVGDMPAKTVEHRTKEVTKPAGLEDLLALVQQKESGGRRYGPTGEVLTSPKGAMGEMQVMPGTARDPGFGIRPAKEGDLEDLARVGREYFAKMLERYNDPKIAAVAYNWGPGNTDRWLMAGADPKALPAETRKYMQGFAEGGIVSLQSGGMPDAFKMTPEEIAEMQRRIIRREAARAAFSAMPEAAAAPSAAAPAAAAESSAFSRFLSPLEKVIKSPFTRGAGVMSLLTPSSLNEGEQAELERLRKMPPTIYEGANAPPIPPAHAVRMEQERQQRIAEAQAATDRQDLENAVASGVPVAPPAAAEPEAAAPSAPAESEGMASLRKYIQEGMAEAKSQKEIDKYMALLQAGFGMLGGGSRFASENIGRGALMGAQAYQEAAKARAADQRALLSAQLGLERYEQLGKFREAQLAAGAVGKEEKNKLQAAQIAARMESDAMNRAEQTARALISKNPMMSMDEAKSNAYIQEARASARNKLNTNEMYRRLVRKAYEGYDPAQVDIGPDIESLIGKYLQPKK